MLIIFMTAIVAMDIMYMINPYTQDMSIDKYLGE